jgi:uncharacterized protein (TIGR02300 family)
VSQGSALKDPSAAAARGAKQTCVNEDCGRRFYDLQRSPVVCPYCGTPYDATAVARHEFEMATKPKKGKSYRLVEPPAPVADDDAETEVVAEADDGTDVDDGAASAPDILIDIDDEDEDAAGEVLGHDTPRDEAS